MKLYIMYKANVEAIGTILLVVSPENEWKATHRTHTHTQNKSAMNFLWSVHLYKRKHGIWTTLYIRATFSPVFFSSVFGHCVVARMTFSDLLLSSCWSWLMETIALSHCIGFNCERHSFAFSLHRRPHHALNSLAVLVFFSSSFRRHIDIRSICINKSIKLYHSIETNQANQMWGYRMSWPCKLA